MSKAIFEYKRLTLTVVAYARRPAAVLFFL